MTCSSCEYAFGEVCEYAYDFRTKRLFRLSDSVSSEETLSLFRDPPSTVLFRVMCDRCAYKFIERERPREFPSEDPLECICCDRSEDLFQIDHTHLGEDGKVYISFNTGDTNDEYETRWIISCDLETSYRWNIFPDSCYTDTLSNRREYLCEHCLILGSYEEHNQDSILIKRLVCFVCRDTHEANEASSLRYGWHWGNFDIQGQIIYPGYGSGHDLHLYCTHDPLTGEMFFPREEYSNKIICDICLKKEHEQGRLLLCNIVM